VIGRQRVLVTGASGFLGRAVVEASARAGLAVTATLRASMSAQPAINGVDYVDVGDIHADTDWTSALQDVDVVIHTAGVLQGVNAETLTRVNVEGTDCLARHCVTRGVRRFVFVSSLGVHGSRGSNRAIRADDPLLPYDAYTQSKAEAEARIRSVFLGASTDWVIVRPPLIYGPQAHGTTRRMAQVLRLRLPLPLAAIRNRRSAISVRHLAEFLVYVLTCREASNRAWLVADECDYSSLELFERVARVFGYPCRAFSCPESWLRRVGYALQLGREVDQLTQSLFIDRSAIREQLSWPTSGSE